MKKVIKNKIVALTIKKGQVKLVTPLMIQNLEGGKYLTGDYKTVELYRLYDDPDKQEKIVYGFDIEECDRVIKLHINEVMDDALKAFQSRKELSEI